MSCGDDNNALTRPVGNERRYGANPERSWTIEANDGQTAQEIVDDDTWTSNDLVHQLARDLIAAQARIAELEKSLLRERGTALSNCERAWEATRELDAAEATIARVRDIANIADELRARSALTAERVALRGIQAAIAGPAKEGE